MHRPALAKAVRVTTLYKPMLPVLPSLLREQFPVDSALPPSSLRIAQPGPGILTVADSGTNTLIVGKRWRWTTMAVSSSDPRILSQTAYSRQAGRMIMGLFNNLSGRGFWGFDSLGTRSPQTHSLFIIGVSAAAIVTASGAQPGLAGLGVGDFEFAIVQRSAGAIYLLRGGVTYYEWTPVWIDDTGTTALFAGAGVANGSGTCDTDDLLVADLAAPYLDDYGLVTQRVAAPVSPQDIAHTADAILELTWTPQAAQTLTLLFRRTDDSNCFKLVCDQAGGTIKLFRRQASVDTELDAGKVQTWTAGTSRRIVITLLGSAIRTYVANVDKHSATDSFQATATGASASGFTTAAAFISWPRPLAGAALTELARYATFLAGGSPVLDGYASRVLALSPLAYWPCNELRGSVIQDASGHSRIGWVQNVTRGVGGKYGAAFQFGGASTSKMNSSPALTAAINMNEYSMACWIKVNVRPDIAAVRVFNTYDLGFNEYSALEIRIGAEVGIYLLENGVQQNIGAANFPAAADGAWTHVVLYNSLSQGVVGLYWNDVKYEFARTLGGATGPINPDFPEMMLWLDGAAQHIVWFDHKLAQAEVNSLQ